MLEASVDMLGEEEVALLNKALSSGEPRFVADPLMEFEPVDNGLEVRLELALLLLGVR